MNARVCVCVYVTLHTYIRKERYLYINIDGTRWNEPSATPIFVPRCFYHEPILNVCRQFRRNSYPRSRFKTIIAFSGAMPFFHIFLSIQVHCRFRIHFRVTILTDSIENNEINCLFFIFRDLLSIAGP